MTEDALRRRRILVVDDEEANVVLLEQLLRRDGYANVTGTGDPAEVPRLCRELRPDLLLLDLHMPALDGFEVMRRLADEEVAADLPVLVLTADTTPETKRQALSTGASDFLTKPFDAVEVMLRVRNLLHTRSLQLRLAHQNEALERKVDERTAALRRAMSRLEHSSAETIRRLARAIEHRDPETGDHIERMSRYCALLAGRLGVDPEAILIASPMHDVGKIAVRDDVLRKPGRLTPDERREMERHAQAGYEVLSGSDSDLLELAATIAWTHHERWDGGGYPRGLAGEAIPLAGRIAGVADVFDALTSDRVYRPAFPIETALEMMRSERGKHFDPEVLDALLDSLDAVAAIPERDGSGAPEQVLRPELPLTPFV